MISQILFVCSASFLTCCAVIFSRFFFALSRKLVYYTSFPLFCQYLFSRFLKIFEIFWCLSARSELVYYTALFIFCQVLFSYFQNFSWWVPPSRDELAYYTTLLPFCQGLFLFFIEIGFYFYSFVEMYCFNALPNMACRRYNLRLHMNCSASVKPLLRRIFRTYPLKAGIPCRYV